jgi:AbrB family looped-hinge helix DNA binding protein
VLKNTLNLCSRRRQRGRGGPFQVQIRLFQVQIRLFRVQQPEVVALLRKKLMKTQREWLPAPRSPLPTRAMPTKARFRETIGDKRSRLQARAEALSLRTTKRSEQVGCCRRITYQEAGMRLNSKGQVTIPAALRARYGLHEGDEVEVIEDGNTLRIVRAKASPTRGERLVAKMRSRATTTKSTEQLLELLRGE